MKVYINMKRYLSVEGRTVIWKREGVGILNRNCYLFFQYRFLYQSLVYGELVKNMGLGILIMVDIYWVI